MLQQKLLNLKRGFLAPENDLCATENAAEDETNVENTDIAAAGVTESAEKTVTDGTNTVISEFEAEGEFTKVQHRKKVATRIAPTLCPTSNKSKLGQSRKDAKGPVRTQNNSTDKLKGIALPLSQ